MITCADSLKYLKTMGENSIDCMITDPPYGLAFMGRDWDKAVIPKEHWAECLRVLKPGAFACIMSAPRQDVLSRSIINVQDAGFKVDYTPIFWAYQSGFPKYSRTDLAIDRRFKTEHTVVGTSKNRQDFKKDGLDNRLAGKSKNNSMMLVNGSRSDIPIIEGAHPKAKAMKGSILGFQPKPAVEPIIIAMKPARGGYLDQAIKDGHGLTWIDGARIPYGKNDTDKRIGTNAVMKSENHNGSCKFMDSIHHQAFKDGGRFPADVLVSDGGTGNESFDSKFDLDAWAAQFVITPKASRSEKEKGLSLRDADTVNDGRTKTNNTAYQRGATKRFNTHPTVKPIKLMSYLVELFSRPGHVILDPFAGSGTTGIAAELAGREFIGIEKDPKSASIAESRLNHWGRGMTLDKFIKNAAKKRGLSH